MSILWFGLLAGASMVGLLIVATRYSSWPIPTDTKNDQKWSIALIVCLVVSLAVLLGWGKWSETVQLSTEKQQQEIHFLLDMDNGERNFVILQRENSLQYCYINEHAQLTTESVDPALARAVFDDGNYDYVVVEKELQTSRQEWGFLKGPKHTSLEVISYEFHLPVGSIFMIGG